MRSVYEQRRANLRNLVAQWGGPTSMAKKLRHSNGSYLAQLIGPNPSREISEKVAREVEDILNLPAGWLDQPQPGAQQVDDQTVSDCVRAVSAALGDLGAVATPQRMADLVALAYEHCKLVGRVDENFIIKLVRLTAK